MSETAAGIGNLEVSVSFGRFENDLLSWEKWSSFSQNKYLEEVEKCSTPGSVAEKKAYFEAHYKMIAAKKVEIEDQQKQFEATLSQATIIEKIGTDKEQNQFEEGSLVEEKPICDNPVGEKSEIKDNGKQIELDLAPESCRGAYPNQSSCNGTADFQSSESHADDTQLVNEGTNSNNEPGSSNVVKLASDGYIDKMLPTTISVGEKQETNSRSESSGTVDGFAGDLEHEAHSKDFLRLVEAPTEAKLDTVEVLKSSTEEMTKLKRHKMTKVPLKTTDTRVSKVKKAPLSVTPRPLHISSSTSKRTMPTPTPTMIAVSRSSAVKGSTSSSSIKKPAPRTGTVLSSTLGRESTVTAPQKSKSKSKEKVREKDTVKRVLKSFQHNSVPVASPGEQSDSLQHQVLWNAKETKVKEMLTSQSIRTHSLSEDVLTSSQASSPSTPMRTSSARPLVPCCNACKFISGRPTFIRERPVINYGCICPHKGKEWLHRAGAIRANVAQKTAPLLANSRTDTVTRKGKEMKVSTNPNATSAGSHVLAKSKEAKETNVKDQQQSRMFKATPLPAFYRMTGVNKRRIQSHTLLTSIRTSAHEA